MPAAPLGTVRTVLGRYIRELAVHRDRARGARSPGPRIVVFPSNQPWDAASNLRAWLVAPELEKLGWRVTIVPAMLTLAQRRRILRLERPDVILLQQTRHPLNDPRLYAPTPCVLDADDADYLDPKLTDHIAACASSAAAVIGGSRFVAECLGKHNPNATVIWTCTPSLAPRPKTPPANRESIVAWAHASPLTYKAESDFVQRVMVGVNRRAPCTFWLFGTTESEGASWLAPIRAAGGRCEAIPPMDYDAYLSKVAEAAVGLQPVSAQNTFARGKSFGKLLAYLSGQVAVVASNSVDHPLFFRSGENGVLADDEIDQWVDGIALLLQDPQLRETMALRAWQEFRDRLTTQEFARRLDQVLRDVVR